MSTLVIHAPRQTAEEEHKRTFNETFARGVGNEYAIPSTLIGRIHAGCGVVLLCKDDKKRAEGKLIKLERRSKANNGMQRYDVHIKDLKLVPYKAEKLGRTGIAVI